MMLCDSLSDRVRTWIRDYDRLQYFAVVLIYIQIGCALIGSLGALFNGVLLIDLAIALFALVAIESSSQSLGRTYAVLLVCAILLDISWFTLFSYEIWNISSKFYGRFVIFSVRVTLVMQIIGCSVRLLSSLFWIQIYRLGVSNVETTVPREADFDFRTSFLSPRAPIVVRQSSGSDDVIGGSIYNPVHYSSLFEDGRADRSPSEVGSPVWVLAKISLLLQRITLKTPKYDLLRQMVVCAPQDCYEQEDQKGDGGFEFMKSMEDPKGKN